MLSARGKITVKIRFLTRSMSVYAWLHILKDHIAKMKETVSFMLREIAVHVMEEA